MNRPTKHFLIPLFAVVAAFVASAAAGQMTVEYLDLWPEPVVGPLCAASVILAAFWAAPKSKIAAGTIALLLGILAAWWMLDHTTYPEGCIKAYQPTLIPLVSTIGSGVLTYVCCCLMCGRGRT